ncbi:MAG TPA: GNAT family N-acetyltransferase [Anaerolineae bacterium]|nr:GNAT family N-acetyltransferase [Anaerolineae bacterium]
MEGIRIVNVGEEHIEALCRLCVPPERRDEPEFIRGMEEKGKWAVTMLHEWGSFAKLAYRGSSPVGLIQYEPIPDERAVSILCIYVPDREHWRLNAASKLLDSLIEEMEKPKDCFGGRTARVLVTRTFPGEKPDQYPARSFFLRKGFQQVGDDANHLYLPLIEGLTYHPVAEKQVSYLPQREDRGIAVIIHGPTFCPYSYLFLKRAERLIMEVAPGVQIRWIDSAVEPEEAEKRGLNEGCVVNAKHIKAFVLQEEDFKAEVSQALCNDEDD